MSYATYLFYYTIDFFTTQPMLVLHRRLLYYTAVFYYTTDFLITQPISLLHGRGARGMGEGEVGMRKESGEAAGGEGMREAVISLYLYSFLFGENLQSLIMAESLAHARLFTFPPNVVYARQSTPDNTRQTTKGDCKRSGPFLRDYRLQILLRSG